MRDTASFWSVAAARAVAGNLPSSVAAMAFRRGIERRCRGSTRPSLAGSYTPPPNKPTSVHLSPTASSRNPKTIGMPKAPIEYAHEIKQCTFSPRVRETASFFQHRGDGVKVG